MDSGSKWGAARLGSRIVRFGGTANLLVAGFWFFVIGYSNYIKVALAGDGCGCDETFALSEDESLRLSNWIEILAVRWKSRHNLWSGDQEIPRCRSWSDHQI